MSVENLSTPEQSPAISMGDAVVQIAGLQWEITAMGANDSEIYTVQEIMGQLRGETITPQQALEQAASIRYGKQDYH